MLLWSLLFYMFKILHLAFICRSFAVAKHHGAIFFTRNNTQGQQKPLPSHSSFNPFVRPSYGIHESFVCPLYGIHGSFVIVGCIQGWDLKSWWWKPSQGAPIDVCRVFMQGACWDSLWVCLWRPLCTWLRVKESKWYCFSLRDTDLHNTLV